MEFHEKLQELRRQGGLTQQELAERLYVSRTAVSKWESGRGYPSIDSLKAIADFFSVTVDELLSTNEILTLAETDGKQKQANLRGLMLGLLDLCMALLLFLPLFAVRTETGAQAVFLWNWQGVQPYIRICYMTVVIGSVLFGIFSLAMQACQSPAWMRIKTAVTLSLGVVAVLLFTVGTQPYAAILALVLLGIKVLILLWRR